MLGTVVVLLQAEAGGGLDLDALKLETPTFVDAVVPALGVVQLTMQGSLFAFLLLQGMTICFTF